MLNFSTEVPVNETKFDLRVLCWIGCICNFVVQTVNIAKASTAIQHERQDSVSQSNSFSFTELLVCVVNQLTLIDMVLISISHEVIKLQCFRTCRTKHHSVQSNTQAPL